MTPKERLEKMEKEKTQRERTEKMAKAKEKGNHVGFSQKQKMGVRMDNAVQDTTDC